MAHASRWLVPQVARAPRWLQPRPHHTFSLVMCVSSSLEQQLLTLMGGKSPGNFAEIRWTRAPGGELSACPYLDIPREGLGHRYCLNEASGPSGVCGLLDDQHMDTTDALPVLTVTGLCCLEEVAPTRGQARVAGEDQCTPLRLRGPRGRGHRRLCHDGQKALGHVLRLVWREEPPLPPILLLMEHRAGSDGDGSDDGSDVGLTPGV